MPPLVRSAVSARYYTNLKCPRAQSAREGLQATKLRGYQRQMSLCQMNLKESILPQERMDGPQSRWQSRANRCRALHTEYSLATPALRLYAEVLTFQCDVSRGFRQIVDPSRSLRDQIDLDVFCSLVPRT